MAIRTIETWMRLYPSTWAEIMRIPHEPTDCEIHTEPSKNGHESECKVLLGIHFMRIGDCYEHSDAYRAFCNEMGESPETCETDSQYCDVLDEYWRLHKTAIQDVKGDIPVRETRWIGYK